MLPVIAFHAGLSTLSGGFTGVDIFFVLSGYLITGILLRELSEDRFSILRFYERRARRILPALFAVILACLPFAWLWMTPDELAAFARSLMSVLAFVSNHFFWSEEGYFAAASELKPLLHTWSLAVEEQFYLFFPPLLWLIWRFGRNVSFGAVILLSLGSLVLAQFGSERRPDMAFYLLPFRAWELGIGAACAFWLNGTTRQNVPVLGWLGLALIVASFFVIGVDTPWPSLWTLLPVVGTALLILFARPEHGAGALLAMRAPVAIGLISYSAYLWHQPLFAFARLRSIGEPSPWLMAALAVLALGLAAVTWRYVEQPFRAGPLPWLPRKRQVFAAAAAVSAAFAAVAGALWLAQGVPGRLSPVEREILATTKDRPSISRRCELSNLNDLPQHPEVDCLLGPAPRPEIVLAGDSHAYGMADMMLGATPDGVTSYVSTFVGCVPTAALKAQAFRTHEGCTRSDTNLRNYLDTLESPVVVLSARWQAYLRGPRFDNGEGGIEHGRSFTVDVVDTEGIDPSEAAREARVLKAYRDAVTALLDRGPVVLVYPVPEAAWNVPLRAFKLARFSGGAVETISTDATLFEARSAPVLELFDSIDHPNLFRVRPHEALCNTVTPGRCLNTTPDGILYKDDDHLSGAGLALVEPAIRAAVKAALDRRSVIIGSLANDG